MLSTLPLDLILALGRQRWMVPLLAGFDRQPGARFVELVNRLGLPRDSLVRTLEAAQAAGWVMRNPGYGHPLRPEYVLTDAGCVAAATAAQIAAALSQAGLSSAELTRWSLPVLHALSGGQERFNELARYLAPATPRALSITLRTLVANDLIDREIEAGFPPSSRYRLTSRGAALACKD